MSNAFLYVFLNINGVSIHFAIATQYKNMISSFKHHFQQTKQFARKYNYAIWPSTGDRSISQLYMLTKPFKSNGMASKCSNMTAFKSPLLPFEPTIRCISFVDKQTRRIDEKKHTQAHCCCEMPAVR